MEKQKLFVSKLNILFYLKNYYKCSCTAYLVSKICCAPPSQIVYKKGHDERKAKYTSLADSPEMELAKKNFANRSDVRLPWFLCLLNQFPNQIESYHKWSFQFPSINLSKFHLSKLFKFFLAQSNTFYLQLYCSFILYCILRSEQQILCIG